MNRIDWTEARSEEEIRMDNKYGDFVQRYREQVSACIAKIDMGQVGKLCHILVAARDRGNRIYVIGNGGSAAAASHFACDLGKTASLPAKVPFPVVAIGDNVAWTTALANDVGAEEIFVQPLKALLQRGDVLIAISTRGNSPNLVKAVSLAKEIGSEVIAVCGYDGGKIGPMADHMIHIPSHHMGIVEDAELMVLQACVYALAEMGS